ncbi:DUF4261 domain-containing protein [Schaalia suimastitidis]|uniref:DUF4261 domain-containing protein n=1 Tax=Schaalia suimastitidis TaxID=121163 RepID=UPI0004029B29|nr:DUF4261 domain-containing protein [Schaalia suimastitidis]
MWNIFRKKKTMEKTIRDNPHLNDTVEPDSIVTAFVLFSSLPARGDLLAALAASPSLGQVRIDSGGARVEASADSGAESYSHSRADLGTKEDAADEDHDGPLCVEMGDTHVYIMPIDAPVPDGEAENNAHPLLFPEGFKGHQSAHAIVSAMTIEDRGVAAVGGTSGTADGRDSASENDSADGALMTPERDDASHTPAHGCSAAKEDTPRQAQYRRLQAHGRVLAALAALPECIGVYVGQAGTTLPASFVADMLGAEPHYSSVYTPIWVWQSETGAVNAYSYGLRALGHVEIQVRDLKQPLDQAFPYLLDIAEYLIQGATIRAGETLGTTADDKRATRYEPWMADASVTALQIDM